MLNMIRLSVFVFSIKLSKEVSVLWIFPVYLTMWYLPVLFSWVPPSTSTSCFIPSFHILRLYHCTPFRSPLQALSIEWEINETRHFLLIFFSCFHCPMSKNSEKLKVSFLLNEEADKNGKDQRRRGQGSSSADRGAPSESSSIRRNREAPGESRTSGRSSHMGSSPIAGPSAGGSSSASSTKGYRCILCHKVFQERGRFNLRHFMCKKPPQQKRFFKFFCRNELMLTNENNVTMLWIMCQHEGNLNKHINTVHRKEKPQVCPEPGCGKSFSYRDGLLRHVSQVHKGIRPYGCKKCGKTFKQASHLAKHMRTIHNDDTWPSTWYIMPLIYAGKRPDLLN